MIGATPGPFTCFLLERGLKTFALRMEHHNKAGLAVAKMLEAHPRSKRSGILAKVPSRLQGCEKADARARQPVTFLVKEATGRRGSYRFSEAVPDYPSLGGSESLVTQMAVMSFFDYPRSTGNP